MGAAWRIARKDLLLRLRDRSALLVGVVVPFVLAFVFNLVFGGAFGTGTLLAVGFADGDGGEAAAALSTGLLELEEAGTIDVVFADDEAELRSLIETGGLNVGIYVPEGLGAAIASGEIATLDVLQSVDAPTAGTIGRAIAAEFAYRVADAQRVVAAVSHLEDGPVDPSRAARLADRAASASPVVVLSEIEAADGILDPPTFFAAGMAVFFLFFLVQFGVSGLLDEEREGTLVRLQAAPIPRWSVVLGKALTSLILGVLALTVLAVTSTLLMGASWGHPLGVAILILAVTLASTAIVGVVAGTARTPEGAGNLVSIIAVALGMLGGTFFPVAGGNRLIEALSLATPHAWFLRGMSGLATDQGLGPIVPSVAALLAFAFVVGAAASLALRRRFA